MFTSAVLTVIVVFSYILKFHFWEVLALLIIILTLEVGFIVCLSNAKSVFASLFSFRQNDNLKTKVSSFFLKRKHSVGRVRRVW